jgi:hypothetical protein
VAVRSAFNKRPTAVFAPRPVAALNMMLPEFASLYRSRSLAIPVICLGIANERWLRPIALKRTDSCLLSSAPPWSLVP